MAQRVTHPVGPQHPVGCRFSFHEFLSTKSSRDVGGGFSVPSLECLDSLSWRWVPESSVAPRFEADCFLSLEPVL